MFNFKKYPELIPYHKKNVKYSMKLTRLATVSVEKDSDAASKKFHELYVEGREFQKLYGQKVYELLKDVKPKFFNRRTKEYENWDTVVEHFRSKNTENSLAFLICATEEDGGLYRFPPEYYDPNLTDKML